MADFKSLIASFKKKLTDDEGLYQRGKFTPIQGQPIRSPIPNYTPQTQGVYNAPQFGSLGYKMNNVQRTVLKPLARIADNFKFAAENPATAGRFLNQTIQKTPILPSGLKQGIGNYVSNAGQTVFSGIGDITKGQERLRQPGVLNKAAGSLQTLRGIGKTAIPFYPGSNALFSGANMLTSMPQIGKGDATRRISKGIITGMSGESLAQNVRDRNVDIGGVKFDPYQAAGSMVGYVKNPVNDKFFKLTETILPSNGKIGEWLIKTAARGGTENIALNLPDMDTNLSPQEKAQWVLSTFGSGAGQEIVGRGILAGLGKLNSKTLGDPAVQKQLAGVYDKISDQIRVWKRPVNMYYQELGKSIKAPQILHDLGIAKALNDDRGFAKLDEPIKIGKDNPQQRPRDMGNASYVDANGSVFDVYQHMYDVYGTPDLRVVTTPKELNIEHSQRLTPNQIKTLTRMFDRIKGNSRDAKINVDFGNKSGTFNSIDEVVKFSSGTPKFKIRPQQINTGAYTAIDPKTGQKVVDPRLPGIMYTTSKTKAEGRKMKVKANPETDPFLKELEQDQTFHDTGMKSPPGGRKKPPKESYSGPKTDVMINEALVNSDIKEKEFRDIIARYIGKSDAAQTKGTQKSLKFTDIPEKIAVDVIKVRENPNAKVSPEAKAYAKELGKEFDTLFKEVKKMDEFTKQDTNYLKNYITHIWEQSPQQVQEAYKTAKQKFKFSNERTVPTYEEGIKMGLTPKYTRPAEIMQEYVKRLEQTKASIELFRELKRENLVVPASVAVGRPEFEAIQAPGFPRSISQGADGKTYYGTYYAPRNIAQQINKLFSPNEGNAILRTTAKLSSSLQDVTLSGGVPKTPLNAFSLANMIKEFTAGRVVSPIASMVRSFSGDASKEYFAKKADVITRMQERNIPIRTEFNATDLVDKGWVKNTFGDDMGQAWNKTVNDPTFKRFMPMLQVQMFDDVEKQAIKQGMSPDQAADIAAKAVKNFYGVIGSDTQTLRNKNIQNALSTFLFAPKYRESMINFWVNNVKALKNPLALENRANVKFMVGALLTYGAYDLLNQQFNNGKHLHENPPGTEDKLLIPVGDGNVIGIPFLSSIATMPRLGYRMIRRGIEGDFPGMLREGKSAMSQLTRTPLDVLTNENYFGQEIYDPADSSEQKIKKIVAYVGGQYNHPYTRALIEAGALQGIGIPGKEQPNYALVSKMLELPIRFYTDKSLRGGEYYANVDKAVGKLTQDKKQVYETVYEQSKKDLDKVERMRKSMSDAQLLLANPEVLQARQQVEINTAKRTGQPIKPFWNLTPEQQRIALTIQSLPPGDKQKKAMQSEYIDFLKPYWIATSAYYEELKAKGFYEPEDQEVSDYFKTPDNIRKIQDEYFALPYGTGARKAFIFQHPELTQYWDEKRAYENELRALLGLPPIEDAFGGGSKWGSNKKPKKTQFKIAKQKSITPIKLGNTKIRAPKIQIASNQPKKTFKIAPYRGTKIKFDSL